LGKPPLSKGGGGFLFYRGYYSLRCNTEKFKLISRSTFKNQKPGFCEKTKCGNKESSINKSA
jgi:hypothetical protein